MSLNSKSSFSHKSLRGILLASAVVVGAISLTPAAGNLFAVSSASAEAVKLPAPAHSGFGDVVEAVSPAVVSVNVKQEIQPASNRKDFRFDRRNNDNIPEFFKRNPDFFKRFLGEKGPRREGRRHRRHATSQGSGFFISKDGYIVTNHHVIDGGSNYSITLDDGTELDAKLIGADKRSDLAVLKVEEDREFTYVDFAEGRPRIGDWVVAVGNPFGLGGTVTAGIVSAHDRELNTSRYDDFIQIDAAVNKGNSGGPAFNLQGEVIGVNTAIFSPSGGNVGIAFAIPAKTTKEIVGEIIENGSVVRGWLGVQIQPVTKDIAEALGLKKAKGALVSSASDGSPAQQAGIHSGDIITKVNGKKVKGPRALARLIGNHDPDQTVTLTIFRDGDEDEVKVKLGELQAAALDNSDELTKPKSTNRLGLALGKSPDGGVLVLEVAPQSTAARKGIRSGDVIGQVNGEKVESAQDVGRLVKEAEKSGRKNTLFMIEREGTTRFVAVPFPKAG